MLSGRQKPEDIEPLQVVVNDHGLHIVRGHRRGQALCALQGMWRHEIVRAPCRLYGPTDPEVASPFANMDTRVAGLAVQLHGTCPEAWHMGKPLFRTPQEWCDSTEGSKGRAQTSRPSEYQQASAASACAAPNRNQQEAFETKVPETSGRQRPAFGFENPSQQFTTQDKEDLTIQRVDAETWGQQSSPEVCVSMLVCVCSGGELLRGEVLELSQSHVKLWYFDWTDEDPWVPMDRVQIPDFSSLQPGMEVTSWWGKWTYSCHILEVSQSKERLRAPVKVRYTYGFGQQDEWIGLDRLELKDVKLLPWKDGQSGLSIQGPPPRESESQFWADSTVVCCLWLMGRCKSTADHWHGRRLFVHQDLPGLPCGFGTICKYKHHETRTANIAGDLELQEGMVVCVKDKNGSTSRAFGEILEISRVSVSDLAPVKVRTYQAGHCHVNWFALDDLLVPNYSKIEHGSKATVEAAGNLFHCTVLQVSNERDKAQAPVYVNYTGYGSNCDEWVGADRLHSASLVFHRPKLAVEGRCHSSHSGPGPRTAVISSPALSSTELRRPSVTQDVVSRVVIEELPDASPTNALPWHEPGFETDAFDHALQATEEALERQTEAEQWQPRLEATLASADTTEALRDVLEKHGWSGPGVLG